MSDPVQPPLFDLPAPLRRPVKAAPEKAGPSYARYAPVRRPLCDDCVDDIHERGVAIAPFPRRARWRRRHDGEVILLCDRHKLERTESDA